MDLVNKRRKFYLEDVQKDSKDIPLVFSADYFQHRSNSDIKQALLKNWHYISENQYLHKIFPNPPLLALRRTQNLGDRLIRAKITSEDDPSLTPITVNDSSYVDLSGPMSPTLVDLLDLLAGND